MPVLSFSFIVIINQKEPSNGNKQMKEHKVGDIVKFAGIDGKSSIEGTVTYIIRDGSNPPWGYVMVSTEDEASHICYPEHLIPINRHK